MKVLRLVAAMLGMVGALALATSEAPRPAQAAEFPTGPITIIVPWPAGGVTDSVTRVIAEELRVSLKQPIIVENRPGAGGRIGSSAVLRAPADGHTVLLATTSSQVLAALAKNPPYDSLEAFAPVILLNSTAGALVASQKFAPNTLAELIAYAKENPGKVNCASIGIGSTSHLSCEMLRSFAKIDIVHVPYKGEAQVISDLTAGQVHIYFLISAKPYVTSGQFKLIGASSRERTAVNPDWPTLDELGLKGFDRSGWQGFMVRSGTPPHVVEKLNAAVDAAMRLPHVRKRLIDLGLDPKGGTPAVLDRTLRDQLADLGAVIKQLGIELH